MNGNSRMGNAGPPGQQQLPPWLANTVNQVCQIWLANQQPFSDPPAVEAYVASFAAGFVELVQRMPVPELQNGTHRFTASYLTIASICRIAPSEAQWRPPSLALVERPKLLVPS